MADKNTIQLLIQAQGNINEFLKQAQGSVDGLNKKVESSKGFIATVKEHWMGLSAAIYAVGAVASKAWDLADQAAQYQEQKDSLDALAAKYGTTADAIIASLKEISGGQLSLQDIVRVSAEAISKGLNPQQLVELTAAAKTLSDVSGTVEENLQGLTEALVTGRSRAIESKIGFIDLNAALGDNAKGMSDAEKQTFMLAEIIKRVNKLQQEGVGATDSAADAMKRFTVQTEDMKLWLGVKLIQAGMGAIGIFQQLAAGIMAVGLVGAYAALGVAKLTDALGLTKGDADKLNTTIETMKIAMNDLDKQASQSFKDMATYADAAKKSGDALNDGIKAQALTYEDYIKGLKAGSEEYKKIQGAETKALEAKIEYEKALLAKSLADKKISQEKYVEEIIKIQEKQFKAEWANLDSQIQAAKAEGEKGFALRAQLEAQKTELIQKHATERLKTETDATNEATKIQEKGFTDWKALQELKLQSMQAQMSLEEAMDKAAVDAGVLRESEAMENSLQRLKEFNQAKLSQLSEAIAKEAALHGANSPEYQKLYAEREQLQMDLQAKIITSEQQIADTRIKEETEALAVLADLTGDREALIEQEYANNLKVIEDYYAQGIYDAQQYNEALDALGEKQTKDLKENTQEQARVMESIVIATAAQTDKLMQSLSDALGTALDKTLYQIEYLLNTWSGGGGMMPNLVRATAEAMREISALIGRIPPEIADMFTKIGIFISGEMFFYAQQIADYVNWIKAQMQGLQSLIQGYQETLLQMQGDEIGLVNLWYNEQLAQLKEQFAGLEDTAEYKKALELLEELYKEKLKIAEEAMKKEQEMWDEAEQKGGSGYNPAGYVYPEETTAGGTVKMTPVWENAFAGLKERLTDALTPATDFFGMDFFTKPMSLDMKKEVRLDTFFELKSLDPDAVRKTCYETIFPEWEKYLKLKGVEL